MTEVIHEHDSSSNNGMGMVLGVILAIALIFFLVYYFGRGLFFGASNAPQVNIPDHVNVNVNPNQSK